jgi:hypothetical protein
MLPEGEMARRVASTIGSFSPQYTIICDTRDVQIETNDIFEMADALYPYDPIIIDYKENIDWVKYHFGKKTKFLPVREGDLPFEYEDVNIVPFRDGYISRSESRLLLEDCDLFSPPNRTEWELVRNLLFSASNYVLPFEQWVQLIKFSEYSISLEGDTSGERIVIGRRHLSKLINRLCSNSLLIQYAFHYGGENLIVTPYHSHAIHSIELKKNILLARPSAIASRTHALLRKDLDYFEQILREPKQKERVIQKYLEAHPEIFHAMGYANVYPQVILERADGTSLRPDFIIEPIGEDWCDILDIKIPQMSVVVGSKDRKTLSSAIHQLAAQLREYRAYFENENLAKRIEQIYGIKCYRPRLIGVVGTNPYLLDERQLRRLMTFYTDIQVLTFDKLLELAKSRLLI